jgi:hypothetical protein
LITPNILTYLIWQKGAKERIELVMISGTFPYGEERVIIEPLGDQML